MEMQVAIYQKDSRYDEIFGFGILNLETRILKFTDCDDFLLEPYYSNHPYSRQDKNSERWQIGITYNGTETRWDIVHPGDELEDMFVEDYSDTVDYIQNLYLLLKMEKELPKKQTLDKKNKI